ncbi:hypothetical protein [Dyadobacter chenhuakuii]|uniref:Uncharacterized protein n=1 Tax=Dyadobacter chenhuakuii TaxID=2909339 RepID=A0A9X1QCR0_9BACT|nr:hypothetical protein [Dyadobacter chenhuakuii]MCF2498711.1 hypothetical protein [Dyadobacter chenhuakuii]
MGIHFGRLVVLTSAPLSVTGNMSVTLSGAEVRTVTQIVTLSGAEVEDRNV